MSRRTDRVAEQIRAELARLLRAEVSDPRIGLVTLTRVDVSPDLRNAFVFWSRLDTADAGRLRESAAGLESAARFARRRLAELLPIKRVPALEFRYDPSLKLGDRTLAKLRELGDGAS
jgi:ribosome-binding factor A